MFPKKEGDTIATDLSGPERWEAGGEYSNRKGGIPKRIHGNYLCEVAETQASRVLVADDGDDEEEEEEEDEEKEDEERGHDDEEEEDEEEEGETVWTSPQTKYVTRKN